MDDASDLAWHDAHEIANMEAEGRATAPVADYGERRAPKEERQLQALRDGLAEAQRGIEEQLEAPRSSGLARLKEYEICKAGWESWLRS